jgi:hypothetical protein
MNQLKKFADLPFLLKLAFVSSLGLFAADVGIFVGMIPVKIDPGLATLSGAIIGLAIVGRQATRGFDNLIRSQENQARLDRDGRLHQRDLDTQKSEQEEDRRRQFLVAALWAEMVSLHSQVRDGIGSARLLAEMAKRLAKQGVKNTGPMVFRTFDAPIYKANIPQLGLLGASVAADVVLVASRATGTPADIKQDHPPSYDMMATLYEGHADFLKDWIYDLFHVGNRLRALMDGTPDPGTLYAEQQRRKAAKPKAGA